MRIKIVQKLIDILRGKDCNLKRIARSYFCYRKAIRQAGKFPKYRIIFKFDDLADCKNKVLKLDKYIRRENLKACWGIIGKSMENPESSYIEFVKNNNLKNYHFFNHGYFHLAAPDYEFFNRTKDEQERLIRKTQDIVFEKTGIVLSSFGAPCNHIDENTKLAIDNIPDIKYWFYGLEDFQGLNIQRFADMEKGVGNPDFCYFLDSMGKLKNNNNIIALQGHPYMWGAEQEYNFHLIVQFLKKMGCEFIFPDDIGEHND